MARYSMVVWYGIVEYCGLDTLILIKGRRRCQIFAQFETISEYINSSVEKALSGLPAPNIPTSHIGNKNISKWSNWTLGGLRSDSCRELFLSLFTFVRPEKFYSLSNWSSRQKKRIKRNLSFPGLYFPFQKSLWMIFPFRLVLQQSDGSFQGF